MRAEKRFKRYPDHEAESSDPEQILIDIFFKYVGAAVPLHLERFVSCVVIRSHIVGKIYYIVQSGPVNLTPSERAMAL